MQAAYSGSLLRLLLILLLFLRTDTTVVRKIRGHLWVLSKVRMVRTSQLIFEILPTNLNLW